MNDASWSRLLTDAYVGSPEGTERSRAGAEACPAPARWLALASGPVAADERRRLEGHLAHCPACAAELELARAFAAPVDAADTDVAYVVAALRAHGPLAAVTPAGSRGIEESAPASSAPAVLPWRGRPATPVWQRWAAAAVLVCGVGVGVVLLRDQLLTGWATGSPPPLGATPATDVVRGGVIEVEGPVGEVATAPERLAWRPSAGASAYQLRLTRVDGSVVWETATAATSVDLPVAIRSALLPGVAYQWRVEARDTTAAVVGRSEEIRFRLSLQLRRR